MYADKKRATKLLHAIGLQLRPIEWQQSGYIGSIQYRGDFVNISGEKFEDVVTTSDSTQFSLPDDSSEQLKELAKENRKLKSRLEAMSAQFKTTDSFSVDKKKYLSTSKALLKSMALNCRRKK